MKFVPIEQQEEKPEITIEREGCTVKSRIKWPEPKRTDREYTEYDDEDREDL